MIIVLHGEDSFRSRQRLKKLKEGFKNKYDSRGLNITTLDGAKLTLEDFNTAAATHGFLSKKRLIVIENLGHNSNKALRDSIQDNVSALPDAENVVIFWEDGTQTKRGRKKSEPLFGLTAGPGVVIEAFPRLTESQMNQWAKKEAASRGAKIGSAALQLMVGLVGEDLWRMNTEIDKLAHYKRGGEITEQDVAALVRAKFDNDIFELTDALAEQDQAKALKLLDEHFSEGVAGQYLLTMLSRQFRILLQVKDELERGQAPSVLAEVLGLHPFVVRKAVNQAKGFTRQRLLAIYHKFLQLDERLKSSAVDQRLLFDLFTVEAALPDLQ
ncbi:MAG: DNA polymerase III subunit delta [bacterium]|nr:DNA polymerase III subunit delta [bacterium]